MLIRSISFVSAFLMLIFLLTGCRQTTEKEMSDALSTASQTESSLVADTENGKTTDTAGTQTMDNVTNNKDTTKSSSATVVTTQQQKPTLTKGTTVFETKATSASVTTTAKKTTTTVAGPLTAYKLTPLPASEYYGYSLLAGMNNGAALVSAYQDIVSGVQSMTKEIELSVPLTAQELLTVFYYYHDDNPQHFWCDNGFQYNLEGNTATSILPQYNMTAAEKETAQLKFEKAVNACLNEASFGKDDYEREKRIHDYLAKQITYQSGKYAHTAYGALVEKKAVCDGNSRAFQWLLYQAGIPALIAEGSSVNPTTGTGEPHAWNVVKIGGQYYHVDLTWNDASSKEVMYAYFNMTTKQIEESHNISTKNTYLLPNCTATAANYHVKNGTVITSYSVDSIASLMGRTEGDLHVYIADKPETFLKWFKTNAGAIAKKIGITGGYSYTTTTLGNEVVLHMASK